MESNTNNGNEMNVQVFSSFDRYEQTTRYSVTYGDRGRGYQITGLHYRDPEAVAVGAAARLRAGDEPADVSAWISAQEG
jgi:hypothetical protein